MKPKTTTAVTNLYAKKERKKKQTWLNLVPFKPASKLFQRREKKVIAFQTSLKVSWTQHRPTLTLDVIEVNNEQE